MGSVEAKSGSSYVKHTIDVTNKTDVTNKIGTILIRLQEHMPGRQESN